MEHTRAEPLDPPGHGPADAPIADDADGGAVQVAAEQQLRLPGEPLAAPHHVAPSTIRRQAASIRPTVMSAVLSVSTSGVFPTGIPRSVAAARSMLSTPTA